MTQKEAAVAVGLTQDQWSHKVRMVINAFTVEELGRIADLFHAPRGWPFIEWDEAARVLGFPEPPKKPEP